ncbi:MAG: tRNA (adenosine(37)-N6)-dimethylallyltransferase MiaA [Candidatus Cloacimonadota bacterium]
MIPVLIIEGPTASGKSALAMAMAESLGSHIISADSRQVYKYLDIGTAKPDQTDRERVKHHFVDFLEPNQAYNAGAFVQAAGEIISGLHYQGLVPVICGGTGLYIRSLLEGLCKLPPIPAVVREELIGELGSRSLAELHEELNQVDPVSAGKISSNDKQRIVRALEVYRYTAKPLSQHWQEQNPPQSYRAFRILIAPPRELLYSRIDSRLDQMLSQGLIEEIKAVLQMGYSAHDPGLNSVGYKEFIPFLQGEQSLGEALLLAKQHSRNYAKRQMTWYRKQTFDLTILSSDFNLSDINRLLSDKLNPSEGL